MSQYIPDLTERFPEGFGGVDLTDRYFPSKRAGWDWEDMSEAELVGYDDIPYETEPPKPKRFEVGQHYIWTSWFTGGQSYYTVKQITDTKVVFAEYRREIDGEYEMEETFEIHMDENGDQYLVMCHYLDEEGRLYAH